MPPPCPLSRVILLYCFESSTREPNATSICARQLSSAEIIIFPNSAFFFINDERDAPLKYHVSSPFQLGNSRENASLYPAVLKYICAYARRHCTQAISHVLWMFFLCFFLSLPSRGLPLIIIRSFRFLQSLGFLRCLRSCARLSATQRTDRRAQKEK